MKKSIETVSLAWLTRKVRQDWEGGRSGLPMYFETDARPFRPTLPLPVETESPAVPANHSFRLDKKERPPPIRPSTAENVPERPISPSNGGSVGISLEDLDLMPQCRVLEDQGLTSPEYGKQKLMDEIKHN